MLRSYRQCLGPSEFPPIGRPWSSCSGVFPPWEALVQLQHSLVIGVFIFRGPNLYQTNQVFCLHGDPQFPFHSVFIRGQRVAQGTGTELGGRGRGRGWGGW